MISLATLALIASESDDVMDHMSILGRKDLVEVEINEWTDIRERAREGGEGEERERRGKKGHKFGLRPPTSLWAVGREGLVYGGGGGKGKGGGGVVPSPSALSMEDAERFLLLNLSSCQLSLSHSSNHKLVFHYQGAIVDPFLFLVLSYFINPK